MNKEHCSVNKQTKYTELTESNSKESLSRRSKSSEEYNTEETFDSRNNSEICDKYSEVL